MPASRRYKVHPYAIKTQEVVDFYEGSTLAEFYSMADSSPTVIGIPILFTRGCWAQCQLRSGIKYVPTPGIFMKLPEWLRGVPGGAMSEVPRGAMCDACI